MKCIKKIIRYIINKIRCYYYPHLCQGSGSGHQSFKGLKLVRHPSKAIGKGYHRWGWYNTLKHLSVLHTETGILFDDFVEQNFCYNSNPEVYNEPWVGIFHHPVNPPYFSNPRENLDTMLDSSAFKKSSKHLKLAIAMSNELANYLRKRLKCKVIMIHHPIGGNPPKFSFYNFIKNKDKSIIQVGNYLRNTSIIHQIDTNFSKVKIVSGLEWLKNYSIRVNMYWRNSNRKYFNDVKELNFQTPSQFDKLLSENIIISEYFALSASNTILDCIIRNTPIIINRTSAAEDYLGKNYPLFFENIDEIKYFNSKSFLNAYNYLIELDKRRFSINYFINKITKEIENL